MSKTIFKGSAILNPVPAVLITSQNSEGKPNVFTVGWISTACTRPPMISVAIRPERLSYEYIKETMNFVVNLPNSSMVKEVDFCGVRSGRQLDKIKEMGFTLEKSQKVASPSISECPVNIECEVRQIISLGSHDLFIAEVVSSSIDDDLIDDMGKIHFEKANLISYSHGEYFPLLNKPLGKFGFSIQKKKKKKR